MTEYAEVPPEIVAKIRSVCVALPEAYEEQAWVGVRWRIRERTFAHVLVLDSGWSCSPTATACWPPGR